jgi:hypothetical protein
LKCHIISAGLWVYYLQISLFISLYQTAVGIISPVEFANEASHGQLMGKSWPHRAASNYLYLFVWANLYILFILFFKPPFWNWAETELKCNIGIRDNILSYTDSCCLVPFSINISCDSRHKVCLCFGYRMRTQYYMWVTTQLSSSQQGTQQEIYYKAHRHL